MEKAEALFLEADALIAAHKLDEAHALLEQILDLDPSFGKAYNHLGWLYETKVGNPEAARLFYEAGLELASDYPALYYNALVNLACLGDWEAFERLLARAELVPQIEQGRLAREQGLMWEQRGDYAQAHAAYERGLTLEENSNKKHILVQDIERCQLKKTLLKEAL